MHDITVDESKQLLTTLTCIGNNSPYDDSDVNNVITPPVNINNESGKSLKESTFPQNELLCFPNLNDQTTVSCLTPNSTAAAGPIAWLKKN